MSGRNDGGTNLKDTKDEHIRINPIITSAPGKIGTILEQTAPIIPQISNKGTFANEEPTTRPIDTRKSKWSIPSKG